MTVCQSLGLWTVFLGAEIIETPIFVYKFVCAPAKVPSTYSDIQMSVRETGKLEVGPFESSGCTGSNILSFVLLLDNRGFDENVQKLFSQTV